jgi:Zn-dependent protease with chaperone function
MTQAIKSSPNAMAIFGKDILVTQPLLELLESTDFTKAPTDELKAVLAHEMHHSANIGKTVLLTRGSVLIMPAAAMLAMYLYDKAHEKSQGTPDKKQIPNPQQLLTDIGTEAEKLEQTLPIESDIEQKKKGHPAITLAKYLAVGTVGLAAGLMVARVSSRHFEFAADRFAAECGHGEALVSALEKIHGNIEQSVAAHPQGNFLRKLIGETIMAHPNLAERIANIRRV